MKYKWVESLMDDSFSFLFLSFFFLFYRRDRNKIEDTADRCAIEGERSAGEDDG